MQITPVKNKIIKDQHKIFVYAYMFIYIWIVYTWQLLTMRKSATSYFGHLNNLIRVVKVVYANKVVMVNGKFKFQLYLPAFPSKPFFHAIAKYDPAVREPGPITVVFSMTKACPYNCPYCYQKNDKGQDLDIELLKKTAKEMQELGVAMFDIEGGEPLVRFDRLLNLMSAFDDRAELWVNTTGYKLTDEQALKLKQAGLYGVMISIHYPNAKQYDEFTGVEGAYDDALRAIKLFQKYGIVTAINFCPTAEVIRTGGVERLMELAKELDVSLVQTIHAKPAGGWLYQKDEIYEDPEMMRKLHHYHYLYNTSAISNQYPSILFQVFEESKEAFGCTAGGVERFYLNHEGEVSPCEFLNISYGNVKDEPFLDIFKRMRKDFEKPGCNWLCCSEAHSIGKCLKDKELSKTPIPKDYSIELVKSWNMGEETKLYQDIKIYHKK